MGTKTVMPAPAANTVNIAVQMEVVVVSVATQALCRLSVRQRAPAPAAHSVKALPRKNPDVNGWSKEEDIATSINDE
jgi:hypothetical protein